MDNDLVRWKKIAKRQGTNAGFWRKEAGKYASIIEDLKFRLSAHTNPPGTRCEGCGCEILDDDYPNIIIGKNPKQYCSKCVKYGRIIGPEGDGWVLTELI